MGMGLQRGPGAEPQWESGGKASRSST